MKNTIKVLGIVALIAVIGFSFAACDNDPGGGDGGNSSGTLRIVNNTGAAIPKLVLQNAEYQDGGTTAYNWSYTYSTPIASKATADIPLTWPISLEKSKGFLPITISKGPPLVNGSANLKNGETTTVTATNDGNLWK